MMAEVWLIFWSWSLVTIVKLKFGEFLEVKIWSRLWGRRLVWNIVGKFWSRFWNWNLVEILKLNFDQILITLTLLKALNPRVYFACGNVLCNAQNCVVIPSIIALSRHFAHMKKENLVLGASGWCHLWWATPKNPLHGGWLRVEAGLTPLSLPTPPLLLRSLSSRLCPVPPTFPTAGPIQVQPHPQFRAQFLNFPIAHLLNNSATNQYPSLYVREECHRWCGTFNWELEDIFVTSREHNLWWS